MSWLEGETCQQTGLRYGHARSAEMDMLSLISDVEFVLRPKNLYDRTFEYTLLLFLYFYDITRQFLPITNLNINPLQAQLIQLFHNIGLSEESGDNHGRLLDFKNYDRSLLDRLSSKFLELLPNERFLEGLGLVVSLYTNKS